MKYTAIQIVAIGLALCAPPAAAAGKDAKAERRHQQITYGARATAPVTLTNGAGDGRLTITVDGYGSFGSTTPAGDVSYNPAGPIAASGAVWESAIFFSPFGNFLSTGSFHTGVDLPLVHIQKPNARTAVSTFRVARYDFRLTQVLQAATATGSTLVQTYAITNRTGADRTITVGRYLEGDLYFSGSFGNDFAGVSADGLTVYQFDSGDDPSRPTTFVGIASTGGRSSGFTIQPYRFSDDIVAARGLPAALNGNIAGDADGDGVTDTGYDVGIYQQNAVRIPNNQTVTFRTSTIFGDGSIDAATADVTGCVKLGDSPLRNRTVTATQPGLPAKTATTDAGGCYAFNLAEGKTFRITISGPVVTAP